MILSKKGVSPDMEFKCSSCNYTIKGSAVLDGEYLYIIQINKENPHKSQFRCECCQDDHDDRELN